MTTEKTAIVMILAWIMTKTTMFSFLQVEQKLKIELNRLIRIFKKDKKKLGSLLQSICKRIPKKLVELAKLSISTKVNSWMKIHIKKPQSMFQV